MYHGNGALDKAIKLLPEKDKKDFNDYVRNNHQFNQGNMFISKSSRIIDSYFSEVFDWLNKCEKLFGFDNLSSYGQKRIYGFLAERYMSYWFKKNTNYCVLPIYFKDISDYI